MKTSFLILCGLVTMSNSAIAYPPGWDPFGTAKIQPAFSVPQRETYGPGFTGRYDVMAESQLNTAFSRRFAEPTVAIRRSGADSANTTGFEFIPQSQARGRAFEPVVAVPFGGGDSANTQGFEYYPASQVPPTADNSPGVPVQGQ